MATLSQAHPSEAPALLVRPDAALLFSKNGQAHITLHNLSRAAHLAVNVAATHAAAIAHPSQALLPPNKQLVIRIALASAAEPLPERIVVRYALVPPHSSAATVGRTLDALRDDWGADSTRAFHTLVCRQAGDASATAEAMLLNGQSDDSSTSALRARLAATERLALLKSTELLRAEQRLAELDALGASGQGGSTRTPGGGSAKLSAVPTGIVLRAAAPMRLLASYIAVAGVALACGVLYADALVGA